MRRLRSIDRGRAESRFRNTAEAEAWNGHMNRDRVKIAWKFDPKLRARSSATKGNPLIRYRPGRPGPTELRNGTLTVLLFDAPNKETATTRWK